MSKRNKKEEKRMIKLEKEYDRLNILERRASIADTLVNLKDEDDKPYFSKKWISKNILKIK